MFVQTKFFKSLGILILSVLFLGACSRIGFMKIEAVDPTSTQSQVRKTLASQLLPVQIEVAANDSLQRKVCSEVQAITRAQNGLESGVNRDLKFSVSANLEGSFFLDSKCLKPATEFVIKTGFSSATFFFKASVEGTLKIAVSTDFFPNAAKVQTVFVGYSVVQNSAPDAVAASFDLNEDELLNGRVQGGDANGDGVNFMLVTAPQHISNGGTFTFASDGTFRYRGTQDYNGEDSFTFLVTDGKAASIPKRVTLNLKPVNDPPIANSASFTIMEDPITPPIVNLSSLVSDVDNAPSSLSIRVSREPSNGTYNPSTGQYIPAPDYFGSDSIQFAVKDGAANEEVFGTIAITILPVNDVPVTQDQTYTLQEDTINLSRTLTASDAENNPLTFLVVSGPSQISNGGSFSLSSSGTFNYKPTPNYNGPDSFTFRVSDGPSSFSETKTVRFTINQVNDAPTASPQTYTLNEDSSQVVNLSSLVGDIDLDSNLNKSGTTDAISISVLTQPQNGTFSQGRYTPTANFNGTDTLIYQVTDSSGLSAQGTVTFLVRAVNDLPEFMSLSYLGNAQEDVDFQISFSVLLNSATIADIDSTSFSFRITSFDSSQGTLRYLSGGAAGQGSTFMPGQTLVFHPANNLNNQTRGGNFAPFRVKVFDGQDLSKIERNVEIAVAAINDAPVVQNISVESRHDKPVAIVLSAIDVENDSLTFNIGTPLHGDVVFDSTDSTGRRVIYTPDTGYRGADGFAFSVKDSGSPELTSNGLVQINVTYPMPITTIVPVCSLQSPIILDENDLKSTVQDVPGARDQDIYYKVVSLPTLGELRKQGVLLSVGDTFTQDDIRRGRVHYSTTSLVEVSDALTFTVDYLNDQEDVTPVLSLPIKALAISCP